MKRYWLGFAFLFLAHKAIAFQLPTDRDGSIAQSAQQVGVKVFLSTGMGAWLVTGATSSMTGSSVAVYGILTSTPGGRGPVDSNTIMSYVELRATNTANRVSELLVPPIGIGTFVSISSTNGLGLTTRYPANVFIEFDPPIIAADNLSVNTSSEPTGGNLHAAIFYRYLSTDTITPEDVWFPTDDYSGAKAVSQSLYGTSPSTANTPGGLADDRLGTEIFDFRTSTAFIMTSASVTNQAPQFLYGWSGSSGTISTRFEIRDATGPVAATVAPNFLPVIYPRTLKAVSGNITSDGLSSFDFVQFNFPWPLIVERGLDIRGLWTSSQNERFRFFVRNRRGRP